MSAPPWTARDRPENIGPSAPCQLRRRPRNADPRSDAGPGRALLAGSPLRGGLPGSGLLRRLRSRRGLRGRRSGGLLRCCRLLRGRLLRRRLLRGGLPRRGALGPLLGEQLGAPLRGQRFQDVGPAQRRVGLAVGDVRPEPAVLDHHRLAGDRVGAQLLERRLGRGPATLLGLGVDRLGLGQRDGEDLVLRPQRAGIGALLQVRAVAAVLRGDLRAVLGGADRTRQGEQLERIVEGDRLQVHRGEQRGGPRLGALGGVLGQHLGDVRAEPAGLRHDRVPRPGVQAQGPLLAHRARQQVTGHLDGQLVGRQLVGDVRPLLGGDLLHVRAVATDAHHDAGVHVADREGRQRPGVDVAELVDQIVQAGVVEVVGARLTAPVEVVQHLEPLGLAAGDLVEVLLHLGGEGVVDQLGEVLLQQPGDGEGEPGRHQGGALLEHVVAAGDGPDDRRVRRRPADLELLELGDQRRLGVAGRRLRLVALGLDPGDVDRPALGQLRQPALGVVGHPVVDRLDVGLEEAGEGDGAAAGDEGAGLPGGRGRPQGDRHRLAAGVGHLGGDGAHPDQLVEPEPVTRQPGLPWRTEGRPGRADGLVRLLGILHLGGVEPRLRRHVVGAVELGGLGPGGPDRLAGQLDGVGTHVGDEATLVQLLGDRHGPLGGEAELATGLLLQRGGAERGVRVADVRLGLDRDDPHRGRLQTGGQRPGAGLVEVDERLGGLPALGGGLLEGAVGVEVAALGDPPTVDRGESGRERLRCGVGAGVQGGLEVPVAGGAEGDPLPLPVDDQPGGDRLHPARRQPRHDLLPQHRGDLVAVQAVEDATGLLGVDQIGVDVARVGDGVLDGVLGDLVEHHPADRHLGPELLLQVPGDRLALAVTVGGEVDVLGALECFLQPAQGRLLVGRDDVERDEAALDVDTGAGPLLALVLGGDLGGTGGQVTDVPAAGLDDVARPQVSLDLGGLGR
ncbi:hypothetical protein SDC9_64147 [bioreactor metagenome]|uniref:Uncharacterized protein n=1 Tax=bioreactor metagenome TaxID=1076179 RepID=A0A644XPS7_9ZZZZ